MEKIRLAIVTSYGLSTGGTEKFLQMVASHLPREDYEVTYYYIESDPERVSTVKKQMLLDAGVELIPYHSEGTYIEGSIIYHHCR